MNFKLFLKTHFKNRNINESDLKIILENVSRDYNLGDFENYSKKIFGYQVLNLLLKTSRGKFFVKILYPSYSKKNSQNYINMILKIINEEISYPKLLKSKQGYLYRINLSSLDYYLCVQKYIEGKNFYELKRNPNFYEIKEIAKQAAKINLIDYKPKYNIVDTWATKTLLKQFPIKRKGLIPNELNLISPIIQKFKYIDLKKLPQSFTHGDLIHTNVMKDERGKIWIVDFGVASYQPRIMELAVLFHDLLIDLNSKTNTEKKRKIALEEYQKIIKLTSQELELLPILTKATHAIYLLSAAYMKRVLKEDSQETDFWYTRSKQALINLN